MDGYPLDCYDYQSTCGAKKLSLDNPRYQPKEKQCTLHPILCVAWVKYSYGQIFRENPSDQEQVPPNKQNYPQIGQSNGVYSKVLKKCLFSRLLPAKHTLKSHVPQDHYQCSQPQQLVGICILKKNYYFSLCQTVTTPTNHGYFQDRFVLNIMSSYHGKSLP